MKDGGNGNGTDLERVCEIDLRGSLDASEIVLGERPRLLRGSVWILFFLVVAAVVFACVTRVNKIVLAAGSVKVEGKLYDVESLVTGVVLEVKAHEGDTVGEGDTLVILDASRLESEKEKIRVQLDHRERERELLDDLIATVEKKTEAQSAFLQQEIQVSKALQRLTKAELDRRTMEIEYQKKRKEKTGEFYAHQYDRIKKLGDKVASEVELEVAKAELELANLGVEESEAGGKLLRESSAPVEQEYARLQVARAEASITLRLLETEVTLGDLQVRLAGVLTDIARLQEERRDLVRRIEEFTIKAPSSGKVTRIQVVRPGEVLQVGDDVASISPGESFVIKALVRNEDRGELGADLARLKARIKFLPFPYQQYGTFEGSLVEVSPDTVDDAGNYYEITIGFHGDELRLRTGSEVELGMRADVDIVTGRELLIWKLLGRLRPKGSGSRSDGP